MARPGRLTRPNLQIRNFAPTVILSPKDQFSSEKTFHIRSQKFSFTRLKKLKFFKQKYCNCYNYRKTKNFLYLLEQLFSYTLTKNLKGFILDVF